MFIDKWKNSFLESFSFLKISSFFVKTFVFILPFQIRSLVYNDMYFLTGGFNEYGSFFVYFGDILILFAVVFFGIALIKKEVLKFDFGNFILFLLLLIFLFFLMFNLVYFDLGLLGLLFCIRFIIFLFLYLLIVNNIVENKSLLRLFVFSMLIQSVIGIFQFIFQSSLGLYFLGESFISADFLGVSKIKFLGDVIIRSYGTFSHPNIFAVFLLVALFWGYFIYKKKFFWLNVVVLILLSGILFTFSRTVFVALFGALLFYFSISNKKIPYKLFTFWISFCLLLVVLFNLGGILNDRIFLSLEDSSLVERSFYHNVAIKMALNNPIGVGMSNFTYEIQNYTSIKLAPWEAQPVHNVYLLLLSELGVVVFIIFVSFLIYLFYVLFYSTLIKRIDVEFGLIQLTILTSFLILFLFDHVFYSFYQAQALFFIYLAVSNNSINNFLFPVKKS